MLGLTAGGIQTCSPKISTSHPQEQLGNEQIETMLQGEYAFNVGFEGLQVGRGQRRRKPRQHGHRHGQQLG